MAVDTAVYFLFLFSILFDLFNDILSLFSLVMLTSKRSTVSEGKKPSQSEKDIIPVAWAGPLIVWNVSDEGL